MKPGRFSTVEKYIKNLEAERGAVSYPDYPSCLRILEQASEISSDALFGMGYYYMAEYYLAQEDYEQTMQCLTDCSRYFQKAQMFEYLARTYNMMGAVSDWQNNSSIALLYYYTCMQHADRHGYRYVRGMAEINIARMLTRIKEHSQAIEYYNRSILDFANTEETMRRNGHIVKGMLLCGFCHMELQEIPQVIGLWKQIQEYIQKHSSGFYSQIMLLAYEVCAREAQGKQQLAEEALERWMASIQNKKDVDEVSDIIVGMFNLMERMGKETQIEELIWLFEQLGVEDYPSMSLDIYPYKIMRLLQRGKTEDYIRYTRHYFRLYEQYQEDNRSTTVRVLELQEKLRKVEQEQDDMQADNARLASMALYDSLTELPNRTYLNEYLVQTFERAQRENRLIGVELLDIDFFKQFNDIYGHLAGDRCLETVAEVLKEIRSNSIFCARYGGDEFMIIYFGMTSEEICEVMERIQQKIREKAIPHAASQASEVVTVSQGTFNRVPERKNREWDFRKTADIALYQAKSKGRNGYCLLDCF